MKIFLTRLCFLACAAIAGFAMGRMSSPMQINEYAGHIDSVRTGRCFFVTWFSGRQTGNFGYRVSNGLYPTLKELDKFILDSNNVNNAVITNIIELTQKDYNQFFKKYK
jgi:hypothetical protein